MLLLLSPVLSEGGQQKTPRGVRSSAKPLSSFPAVGRVGLGTMSGEKRLLLDSPDWLPGFVGPGPPPLLIRAFTVCGCESILGVDIAERQARVAPPPRLIDAPTASFPHRRSTPYGFP